MDVLKPEVYWIGSRCYRINPCTTARQPITSNYSENNFPPPGVGGTAGRSAPQQQKPYVEVDDFEGPTTNGLDDDGREASPMENQVEIIKEDGGFKIVCCIPSSLFPHIIGFKGAVKKRIELETRTRIYVPRQNEKGDIVVRGSTERDLKKAFKRLEQIAINGRFKREATHFACFPLNDAAFMEKVAEFKEMVLANCGTSSRGLEEKIFQGTQKLHITICVMVLLDERERHAAAEMLTNLEPEIRQNIRGQKLKIHLKGLEIMNDDPSQVDVLYAKCEPQDENNTIQQIADLVARKFTEKGLGKETKGDKVKLHCTIANTRYRGDQGNYSGDSQQQDGGKRNRNQMTRESFDARSILQKYGNFDFGVVEITEIKIATRFTTASDGFYKCYSSFTI